jgi:hypothetical protein
VIIHIDRAGDVVTKKAETPAEVARLRREAVALDHARHPGVVELIGLEHPGELRLRAVDGPCLADSLGAGRAPWTVTELLAFAAEAATTVADLHDIGVIHGQLTAQHVLIGSERRPVLCSLSHGADGPEGDADGPEGDAAGPEGDVAALGQLLAQSKAGVVGLGEPGAADALDHAVSSATDPDPARRPTARALARMLAEPAPRRRPPAVRGSARAAAAIVVVLLAAAFWLRPGSAASSGRFRVSEPGDPVAVGRWSCRTVLPAVLRPVTGEVWVWDGWPAGPGRRSLTGRLAARVGGATSLRAVTVSPGCDTLLITRRSGPPVAIDP